MRHWNRFRARLSNLFYKQRAESELDREVSAHLSLLADDFERRGMSPAEARLAARRALGGVEQTKELHRDARSFLAVEQLLQDLRHAARGLVKSPGFTTVALLSLMFGIGMNTAIFTLVNGILLKQLPVPDPHRIVEISGQRRTFDFRAFSYPTYRELRTQTAIFQDVVGIMAFRGNLTLGSADPVTANIDLVTGSYFAFFGARPALGRLLDEEDDRNAGTGAVCVLSNDFWHRYFAADPGVIGRKLQIDNRQVEVVGVAAPNFAGAELQRRYDLWMPSSMSPVARESAGSVWLQLMARLRRGISYAEAAARLEAASPAVLAALPNADTNRGQILRIHDASTGLDSWRSKLHDPLMILMGAVTLVLLVACANLANLLLARTQERRQEFAIKLSLGISRWRLLRQLLLETALLAFIGGALAIALSRGLTRFLLAVFNTGNPFVTLQVTPDMTVLLYTFAGCTLTALLAGLYPAWQASRTDAGAGLKGAPLDGRRRSTVRRVLIMAQVSLAVVLLFGASLFTHSLHNLKTIDLGYDVDHVLSVRVAQPGPIRSQKRIKGAPELVGLLDRVRQIPGVQSAALSDPGYLSGAMHAGLVSATDGQGAAQTVDSVFFLNNTPGFLSTLHMPLLKGRDFNDADRDGSQAVAIVNQQFAAQAWPGLDPIGRTLFIKPFTLQVVGVMANGKYFGVKDETRPIVATAFAQSAPANATLEVRVRGGLAQIEHEIRQLVRTSAPDYQVNSASAMDLLRDASIAQERLLAFLSDLFGALGVVLALVGIYGLISYSVTRRTREVGIRMSIGAQRNDVIWLFLREITTLLAAGMAIGLPMALLLARYVTKMLYQVSTNDPAAITATLALLGAGALMAALTPARRATKVNPVQALRYD